jgi:hypothetical protein
MPKHLIPIVATVFVMLFVWLSMAPLLSWYEFGGYAEELEEASFKWSNSGVSDYDYVYEVSSYYAPPVSGPIRIIVRDAEFLNASLVESGENIDISGIAAIPGSIELAFEFIATLLAEYPYAFDVEYDAELGYPKMIMIKFDESTDDEVTYFVRSLEVIRDDF